MKQKGFAPIVVILIGVVIVAAAFFTPYFQNIFNQAAQNVPSPSAKSSASARPKISPTSTSVSTATPPPSPTPSNSSTPRSSPTYMPIPVSAKPVIYLYPTQIQKTTVKLFFNGSFIFTYPAYNYDIQGWEVVAHPDGSITNLADNKQYPYLFWDGIMNFDNYKFAKGFVVPGNKTAEFLENILPQIGLIPKEYNEFIVYWVPKMQKNKYNLIYFADREYAENAKLEVYPKPDSLLRVYMVYKPIDGSINIAPQIFPVFERKGFTVIEWGGREL